MQNIIIIQLRDSFERHKQNFYFLAYFMIMGQPSHLYIDHFSFW